MFCLAVKKTGLAQNFKKKMVFSGLFVVVQWVKNWDFSFFQVFFTNFFLGFKNRRTFAPSNFDAINTAYI